MIKKVLISVQCNACIAIGSVLLVSIAYWLAVPHVSPELMNDLVDGPLVSVSLVTGSYYLTWTLFRCFRPIDRAWMLRFGICLAWLGNGVWRIERFLYARGALSGPIGAHDPLRGYMILIMAVAGVMHIFAIDMEGSRVSASKIIVAAAAVAAGIAGVVAVRAL
jgi:hypothetical protein